MPRTSVVVAALLAALALTGAAEPAVALPAVRADVAAEPASLEFAYTMVDGTGGSSSAVVGNGARLPIMVGWSLRYWGDVPPTPYLVLERRREGRDWEALPVRVPVAAGAQRVVVRTPAYRTTRATERVRYRLRSVADGAAGGFAEDAVSAAYTVVYEDQARYTGLAAQVYREAKAFCPATAVHLQRLHGPAGYYSTGALLIRIDPKVRAVYRMSAQNVRALALHECAHERQWLNYGSTWAGRLAMQKRAATIFTDDAKPDGVTVPYPYTGPTGSGFDPVEHAADCSAQAMNPGGYLGYGGWCDPRELRAGQRLLLGRRY